MELATLNTDTLLPFLFADERTSKRGALSVQSAP